MQEDEGDAEAGPMQSSHSRADLLEILSAEAIELVGRCLQDLAVVGAFNHATAMRHYGTGYSLDLVRQPASAVTMLNRVLLRGVNFDNTRTPYQRAIEVEDSDYDSDVDREDDQADGRAQYLIHAHDALIFPTMYKLCTQHIAAGQAGRVIREMIRMYPLSLVSQNTKGNTPLHELLKKPEWWNKIEPADLLAPKDSIMRCADGVEQRLCRNAYHHNTVLMIALLRFFRIDTDIGKFIDNKCEVLLLRNRQRMIPLHSLFLYNAINLELEHVRLLSVMPEGVGSPESDAILLYQAGRGSMALHTAILVVAGLNDGNALSFEAQQRLRAMLPQIVPLLVDTNSTVLEARYEHVVTCYIDNVEREFSDTPLHLALRLNLSWCVCEQLLGRRKQLLFAHSGCSRDGCDGGDLPVHLALKGSRSLSCVTQLMDDDGRVVRTQNHCGDYPLHTQLRRTSFIQGKKNESFNVVVALHLVQRGMAANNDFLLLRGDGGDQVLHIATMENMPEAVIRAIVTADPRVLLMAKGNNHDHGSELQGMLPMHIALECIRFPKFDMIRLLMDDAMVVLTATRTQDGKLPVQVALSKEPPSAALIALLLSGVSDPPVVLCMPDGTDLRLWHDRLDNKPNNTALHIALIRGASIDVVRLLIDPLGRVMHEEDASGNTPLHTAAAMCKSLVFLQLLVDAQRPNANTLDVRLRVNEDGNTPLHLALRGKCEPENILLLMDPEKSVLWKRNIRGECPLHTLVKSRFVIHTVACEMLWTMVPALEIGMPAVDVLMSGDSDGNTPLHLVLITQTKQVSRALFLLFIGTDDKLLRQQNRFGQTPAHVAELNSVEFAKELVSADVMFMQEFASGHTVLHRQLCLAQECINTDVIVFLIGLDAGILRVPSKRGDFPIHCALRGKKSAKCEKQMATCVGLLLGDSTMHTCNPKVAVEHRGDMRLLKNEMGFTPLRTAVQNVSHHDILRLLVDTDQRVLYDRDEGTGHTPLHVFCGRPMPAVSVFDCVQVLRGTDQGVLLSKDSYGRIPLCHALLHTDDVSLLRMLLPPLFPDRQAFVDTTLAETTELHEMSRRRIRAAKMDGNFEMLPAAALFLDKKGMTVIRTALMHHMKTSFALMELLCTHFQDLVTLTYCDPTFGETDLMCAVRRMAVERRGCTAESLVCLRDKNCETLFMRELKPDTQNTPLHMYLLRFSQNDDISEQLRVVQVLVDPQRMILQTKNSDDHTPLHLACMRNGLGSCMQIFMASSYRNENPIAFAKNIQAAVVVQNKNRQTALHLALRRFGSMDSDETIVSWQNICRQLAGTTPQVLLTADDKGNTPLHEAGLRCPLHSSLNHTSSIMQDMLIDKEQVVLTRQNKDGRTPLHMVAIVCNQSNFRLCLPFLIDKDENVLRTQDAAKQTPLHCCIKSLRDELEIMQLLIDKSEEALLLADDTGCLPLHAALEAGSNDIATVQLLLGKVKSALISQQKNSSGYKPITLALLYPADIEIVQLLLDFAPFPHMRAEALRETFDTGKTLLHIALYVRRPLPIAHLLVDVDKVVLRTTDGAGNTPLHVAVRFAVRGPDVEFLINRDFESETLLARNSLGYMPLHLAVTMTHRDYYEEWMHNIEILMDAERTILFETIPDGLTPLHLAMRYLPPHFTETHNMHLAFMLRRLIDWPQQRVLTMANHTNTFTPLYIALRHLRQDAEMQFVEFLRMLVDPAQDVLRVVAPGPVQHTPLAFFQYRLSNMPGGCLADPVVEAAIVEVLSVDAM